MATYDYNIRMYVNKQCHQTIVAKQFDAASRFLKIQLLQDNGQPYDLTGHRVQFNARKLSGQHIMNDAVMTNPKNGLFSVELTDQTLAEGDTTVTADITVFGANNREVLTTRTFQIRVEKTVRNDNAVKSSNEYNSVVILFRDVWDMRDVIKSVNDKLGEPTDGLAAGEEKAGDSGFGAWNKMWNFLKTQSTAAVVETVNSIEHTLAEVSAEQKNRLVYSTTAITTYRPPVTSMSARSSNINRGVQLLYSFVDFTPPYNGIIAVRFDGSLRVRLTNWDTRASITSGQTATGTIAGLVYPMHTPRAPREDSGGIFLQTVNDVADNISTHIALSGISPTTIISDSATDNPTITSPTISLPTSWRIVPVIAGETLFFGIGAIGRLGSHGYQVELTVSNMTIDIGYTVSGRE